MPIVPISRVGTIGVVNDVPDHLIPPEGWTRSNNVRFADGKAFKSPGYQRVLGTPVVAPTFLMPVEFGGVSYWLYANTAGAGSKVYAIQAGVHTDISKVANYNPGSAITAWNGTVFQGIPILNDQNDTCQYWPTISVATKLADIPGWTAGEKCKFISSYKNYLILLNLTTGGTSFPHRVKWSDGAAPGTLPSSFDVTNGAIDAGQLDLSDLNTGEIVCGGQFGSLFAIYKKDSTWIMRYIGGQEIMSVDPSLGTSGILGPRAFCQVTLPSNEKEVHFVCNGYDIGTFDSTGFQSVVHMKLLRKVFSLIDTTNFGNAFCFNNPLKEEATFAFPTSGQVYPNMALVWNYRDNTVRLTDWVGSYATVGLIDNSNADLWNTNSDAWNSETLQQWNANLRRQVLVANPIIPRLYQLDNGFTIDGTTSYSVLERTGIAIIGQDRQGAPIVDYENRKLFHRLWVKITGGRVNISLGAADKIGSAPVYNSPQLFDPADGFDYIDAGDQGPPNGRLLAVKFEGVGDDPWVLEGYNVEFTFVGGL